MSAGSAVVGAAGGAVGVTVGALTPILFGAAAGPIGMAVGALVAAGAAIASALGVGSGCGPSCIQATNVVNSAEPVFKQNLDAYENGTIDQATAIANYNSMWTAMQQACAAIPGQVNCIGDRQAGACKWKATNQLYPACPPIGSCWNWNNGYYVPLTFPAVNAPSTNGSVTGSSIGSGITEVVSSLTSNPTLLLIGGAIALFAVMESQG